MFFQQLAVPGLGCFSYVIGCAAAGEMIVVDPKRDVQDYLDIARNEGMKITHIIDTHVHADHVSGSHELQALAGGKICMGAGSPVSYVHTSLAEGDTITAGNAQLEVLSTPGHTPHAISLLVTDKTRAQEPWMILTGDLLFVGDIGRPDLVGEAQLDEQVQNLYNSLYVKLAKYPDHLEVFPAHGMGSLCGRGMSAKTSSTLGFERRNNSMLTFKDYEDFYKAMTREFPARPKSFTHIIDTNLKGALLLECCPQDKSLSPDQFESLMDDGAVVIDVRDSAAFSGFHIPGSLNIGFEKQLANWVGMAVEPTAELLLVVNSEKEYNDMVTQLRRIGYDKIFGYLAGGISSWVYSGRPVNKLTQVSVHELKKELISDNPPYLVDVRTPAEVQDGFVRNAHFIPFVDTLENKGTWPKDKEIVIICGSGYRSNIVASHLQNQGYDNVRGVPGGMLAWWRSGFTVEKPSML